PRASRRCGRTWTACGRAPWPHFSNGYFRKVKLMIETVEAINREIVVGIGRERAFEIFTADMTSWWPSAHHIGNAPIERVIIGPRTGGRWYPVHRDGSETYTGVVAVWAPPGRLVVTWQIGADWKYHDDLVTTVDVRFEEESPGRTRVRLEHRDLE